MALLNGFIDILERTIRIQLKSRRVGYLLGAGASWRPHYQHDPDTEEDIHVDDFPCPFPYARMKPLSDSATEGRANPKGIPCLYVATDKETAMSEVRPWLGAILSVAIFKLPKDLKIIDFSVGHEYNSIVLF